MQAVIEVDEGFGGPDLGAKLFACDQLARAVQQGGQYLNRLALQAEFDARLSEFGGANIEFKTIKPQDARGWSRCQHYELTLRLLRLPHFRGLDAGEEGR